MKSNNIIQNTKALKSLPTSWKIIEYHELITDISGGNKKLLKSDFSHKGKYPVIDQGKELISGFSNDQNFLVKGQPPYIIFGDHTRIFKFIDFPFIMGADGTKVLQSNSSLECDLKYIFYFLTTLNIPDTGYNRHYKYLKTSRIPLPPLETQKKIAEILDAADTLRKKTKTLIEKYDQLTQSLFLDMFGDPIINAKGWEETIFTNILVLRRGFDLPIQYRENGPYPVLAANGILDYHESYKIKGPGIVTGRSGTIGQVHYVEENYWPLNTALYSEELNNNNPIFIFHFLKNFKLERFKRGAGVPTLNRNLFHNTTIIKIPLPLQNQFAERVQAIEEQKVKAQASLEKSEELFQSLLQKAFRGEIN